MGWIHQCFVWVTLISSPSYGYNDYIDYPNYHEHDHGHQRALVQNRRSDYSRTNIRPTDRYVDSSESDEQPQHNERSIPYNYNTQRVQEQNRRRPGGTQDDGNRRNENSSFKIVNNVSKPYPGISNRRGGPAQQADNRPSLKDSVVFPGPTSRTSSFVPQITDKECLKTGICEHIPNYPESRVVEILKELEGTKYRFNIDKLDTPDISQRIGSHEEMLDLCKSSERIVSPRAVRDNNNQWYVVLNQQKKPLQGFRIELCQPENAPCSEIIYVDLSRYNKTCIQKHQYRVISVLNSEGELIEKEFALPSCCSCAIQVLNL